jgi:hypothetical protein
MKRAAHRVIRVIVKTLVLSERVEGDRHIFLFGTKSTELRNVLIFEANGAKRSSEEFAIELGIGF